MGYDAGGLRRDGMEIRLIQSSTGEGLRAIAYVAPLTRRYAAATSPRWAEVAAATGFIQSTVMPPHEPLNS